MAEKQAQLFPSDPGPNFSVTENEDYSSRANLYIDQIPDGMIPGTTLDLLRQNATLVGGPRGISLQAFINSANETIEAAGFDAVTGLFNRRVFDEMLEKNVAEAKRGVSPLALVLFDIDNFKEVNERLGHVGGDQQLQTIAQILTGNTRESDIVCRIGGDELAVIMPDAFLDDEKEIVNRVEEIRKKIAKKSVNKARKIGTASIGIVIWDEGMTSVTLYENADRAAYLSKNSGKNKITLGSD